MSSPIIGKSGFKTIVAVEEKAILSGSSRVVINRTSETSITTSKSQTFEFDYAGSIDDKISIYSRTILPMAQLTASGYNSSLFFTGRCEATTRNDLLIGDTGIYRILFASLFDELDAQVQRREVISYQVFISTFEVFSEQFRDLLVEGHETKHKGKENEKEMRKLRIKSSSSYGTYVDGMKYVEIRNAMNAFQIVEQALTRRLWLCALEEKDKNDKGLDPRDVITHGPVGNCFVRIEVKKKTTNENDSVIESTSVCQVTDMASGETLSTNNSTQMRSYSLSSVKNSQNQYLFFFLKYTMIQELYDGKISLAILEQEIGGRLVENQDVWLSRMQTALLALSTLVRIIRIIKSQSRNRDTNVHVPYRDSHFTRVLQPVLSGNFASFSLCLIGAFDNENEKSKSNLKDITEKEKEIEKNEKIEKTVMTLRMASELQGLENYIWTSDRLQSREKRKNELIQVKDWNQNQRKENENERIVEIEAEEGQGQRQRQGQRQGQGQEKEETNTPSSQLTAFTDLYEGLQVELRQMTKDLTAIDRILGLFQYNGYNAVSEEEAASSSLEFKKLLANRVSAENAKEGEQSQDDSANDIDTNLNSDSDINTDDQDSLSLLLPLKAPSILSPKSESKSEARLLPLIISPNQNNSVANVNNDHLSEDLSYRWGGLGTPRAVTPIPSISSSDRNEDGHRDVQLFPVKISIENNNDHNESNNYKLYSKPELELISAPNTRDLTFDNISEVMLPSVKGVSTEKNKNINMIICTDTNIEATMYNNLSSSNSNKFKPSPSVAESMKSHVQTVRVGDTLPYCQSDSESGSGNYEDEKEEPLPAPWTPAYRRMMKEMEEQSQRYKSKNKGRHSCKTEDEDDSAGDDLSSDQRSYLRAVSQSKYSEVEQFLRCGVSVQTMNSFGRDGMQIAARNGDVKMLELLHRRQGRLHSRGPRGDGLIHLAAYNGHLKAIRWLLNSGSVPTVVDMRGQHAGHIAARRCNHETVIYLYEKVGLDFCQEDFDGQTPYQLVPRVASDEDSVLTRAFFESVNIFN
jgi:hypothetical protein